MENKSYCITADEVAQLEHEYEINNMIVYIRKAISEVGDMMLSEAVEELMKKTRFADELTVGNLFH